MLTLRTLSLATLCSAVLALVVPVTSNAGMITFGTGISGSEGDIDTTVLMVAAPVAVPANPVVVDPVIVSAFNRWAEPLAGTQWVSPIVGGTQFRSIAATAPEGDYTFRFTFDLPTGFTDPDLSLQFYTDNVMQQIELNSNPLSFSPSRETVTGQSGTSSASLFQVGTNTLDVTVHNLPPGGFNPMGLDLSATLQFETGAAVVPEPSSLALLATGLLGLMGYGRHCKTRMTATGRPTS